MSLRASQTSKKYFANKFADMGVELIRIRSRTAIRWGEVKSPTFLGMSCDLRYCERMESTYAHVEPFPLVPATWTMLSLARSDCFSKLAKLEERVEEDYGVADLS